MKTCSILFFLLIFLYVGCCRGVWARTYTVTSTGDSGATGTLRWALNEAGTNQDADTISFDFSSGSSPYTIYPLTPLPASSNAVAITATNISGYAGTPLVILDGSSLVCGGTDCHGLTFKSTTNCIIEALCIKNFVSNGLSFDNVDNLEVYGCHVLSNGSHGIYLKACGNALIGGASLPSLRNVVSGNGGAGINLSGGSLHRILGNYIGTDPSGLFAVGNYEGITCEDDEAFIGGTNTGEGNVISGNTNAGIGGYSIHLETLYIRGNYIGVDATGTNAMGNGGYGIFLEGGVGVPKTNDWHIGGAEAGAGNVIAANGRSGIRLENKKVDYARIQGNKIGVDANGAYALGNAEDGIYVVADYVQIGGTNTSERNVISGNGSYGIRLIGDQCVVAGNYIGINALGDTAISNALSGIYVGGGTNLIGGVDEGSENVISGNDYYGLYISPSGLATKVYGNLIGTDAEGVTAVPNDIGIYLQDASSVEIGVADDERGRNIISGNTGDGIYIGGSVSTNVVTRTEIMGNYIGVGVDGAMAIGNGGDGVRFTSVVAVSNWIGNGEVLAANCIAYNGGNGIFLNTTSAAGNHFWCNSIYGNKELGIDLFPVGVTTNDGGFLAGYDTDSGANQLQNFPEIDHAYVGGVYVTGYMPFVRSSSTALTYYVEFFAGTNCDASGYGQGQYFIGATNFVVPTNVTVLSDLSFEYIFPCPVPTNYFITATATGSDGSTSEFSACRQVEEGPGGAVPNWWKLLYYKTTFVLATSDTDGDGFTLFGEYIADTDPTNADSFLNIRNIAYTNDQVVVVVEDVSAARYYDLASSSNLDVGVWGDVFTNLLGVSGGMDITNNTTTNIVNYRINVKLP